MAACADCGHAEVAHMGGCACGCARFTRESSALPPTPGDLAPTLPGGGGTPVERLLKFMYQHLSHDEVNAVIRSFARSKGVPFPGTLHDARQSFIIENFTWRETERHLAEFKRRYQHGEPLVRNDRLAK